MEIAPLILEYLKVLSWPIIVLIVFLLVRKELFKLIHRVSNLELTIKNWKVRFETTGKLTKKHTEELQQVSSVDENMYDSNILLTISDDDFIYLSSLSERPMPSIYYASSEEETYRLNSLCNENIFKKSENNDGGYVLTDLGEDIFEAIAIP